MKTKPNVLYKNKEWLEKQYVTNQLSVREIAKKFGYGKSCIHDWLRRHGIHARTPKELIATGCWDMRGEKNQMFGRVGTKSPRWKAGATRNLRDLYRNQRAKKAAYERDNHTCRRCGVKPVGRGAKHSHHIKPWEKYPELRYELSNIVTLCRSCHRWVHSKQNTNKEFLA